MATILRMKMARPSIYLTTRRVVSPALQSGVRFFNLTTVGPHAGGNGINQRQQGDGIRSTPALPTRFQYRSFSQSMPLSSSSARRMDTDSLPTPVNRKAKKIRIRPKPKMPLQIRSQGRVDVGIENNLPKQSSHTSRILFQTIAPHIEFRTLHHLTKHLSRIISRGHHKFDTQDRDGKKRTLKRRLDTLFEIEGEKEDSDESAALDAEYTWSLKGHPWIQQTIYNYFMGKLLDKPYKKTDVDSNPLTYQEDPTYPPNQNRQQHEKHLNTLVKAREVSLSNPIFWSEKSMRDSGYSFNRNPSQDNDRWEVKEREKKLQEYQQKIAKQHSHKSDVELQSEAEDLLEVLMSCLPPPHFHRLMVTLEGFTQLEDPSSTSQNKSEEGQNDANSWYIDDDESSPLPSLPESRAAHDDWKKHRIPILPKFLSNCSVSHSHLVAVDLGRYFYTDLSNKPEVRKKDNGEDNGIITPDERKDAERKEAARAIQKQRKLQSTEIRYIKTQGEFIEKMMQLQHQFAYWEQAPAAGEQAAAAKEVYHGSALDEGNSSEDVDVTSDLMVAEFEKAPLKKEQQEQLAETLMELRRMGLRSDDDVEQKRSRGRPKKDAHLKFTAIRMEEKDESSASDTESSSQTTTIAEAESEERVIFINNLPIDTTVEEIDQIYSRCGPLESIQLFNLRPDLDPGPLSKKQLQERRRKNKLRNKNLFQSYSEFQRQRPRTPVYGMLRFKSAEGYRVATSPELCIFGAVIRRHPVLSIKHQDITTLYLEQIPTNLFSMDVEYKLAQLLHPQKVHIMLDGMKGVGKNGSGSGDSVNGDYQEYSKPSSCEVKFDDFHTASQVYQWIREGGDGDDEVKKTGNSVTFMGGEDCQVQWFRTPENSMGYWTRELNF